VRGLLKVAAVLQGYPNESWSPREKVVDLNPDGTYAISGLTPGRYVVYLKADRLAGSGGTLAAQFGLFGRPDVTVTDGAVTGGIDFDTTSGALGSVTFTVAMPSQPPVSKKRLLLQSSIKTERGGHLMSLFTPMAGNSRRLVGIPAGTYTLGFYYFLGSWRDGRAMVNLPDVQVVPGGNTPVLLELACGSVSGTVALPGGVSPEKASVKATGEHGWVTAPVKNGAFTMPLVPVGTYVLSGAPGGWKPDGTPQYASNEATVTVKAGQTVKGVSLRTWKR
jgi:hypothetical protein